MRGFLTLLSTAMLSLGHAVTLDAAALAKVLRDAAQAGVPFCEECEKARQAQSRTAAPVV